MKFSGCASQRTSRHTHDTQFVGNKEVRFLSAFAEGDDSRCVEGDPVGQVGVAESLSSRSSLGSDASPNFLDVKGENHVKRGLLDFPS